MSSPTAQSGDRLLWLAAVVVAAMGLGWLVIERPWSSDDALDLVADPAPNDANSIALADTAAPPADAGEARDPLYLARLALDSGMLVEPVEYSAWTLFGAAVDANPDNAEAQAGLDQVAAALLGRGQTAFEQGRLDDAEIVAGTIVTRFPEHAGALELAANIAEARRPPPVVVREAPAPAAAAAPRPPSPEERIPGLHAAFLEAMGQNAVLTPSGTSARDLLGEMIGLAPGHELTGAARTQLVTELLDRSTQSLEALDTAGAEAWIEAAAPLAADPAVIESARDRLMQHLIDTESKKRIPVSALDQTVRVPAQYPDIALERELEGWVDIEFVVTPAGGTAEITVVDASHARYFRNEAIAAVEQWRFEPVIFMGRPIPQLAYTRLEFVIN